jgi:hypothetical protein
MENPEARDTPPRRRPQIQIGVVDCEIFTVIEDEFGGKFAFRLGIESCGEFEKKLREARHKAIQDLHVKNIYDRMKAAKLNGGGNGMEISTESRDASGAGEQALTQPE